MFGHFAANQAFPVSGDPEYVRQAKIALEAEVSQRQAAREQEIRLECIKIAGGDVVAAEELAAFVLRGSRHAV